MKEKNYDRPKEMCRISYCYGLNSSEYRMVYISVSSGQALIIIGVAGVLIYGLDCPYNGQDTATRDSNEKNNYRRTASVKYA